MSVYQVFEFANVVARAQTLIVLLTLLMFKLLYFDLADVSTDNHALKTNRSALPAPCFPHMPFI
jgi:hypothetical protein